LDTTYQCEEKGAILMECEVNKPNSTKCIWKRFGKPIVEDERFKIESENGVQRLIIKNAKLDDAGGISCTCVDQNTNDSEATSTKLTVLGKCFSTLN
jgi:hypothetical protein